jgi:hypothetical protein
LKNKTKAMDDLILTASGLVPANKLINSYQPKNFVPKKVKELLPMENFLPNRH